MVYFILDNVNYTFYREEAFMFIVALPNEQEELLQFLKKEPEVNLFMIADLEFYGMNNNFIKVWYEKSKEKISTVVLTYYKNMILYSDFNDYDVNELMNLVKETNIDFFSCNEFNYKYIKPMFETIFTIRKHILAKITQLIKPKFVLLPAQIASVNDAENIVESLYKVQEFRDYIPQNIKSKVSETIRKIEDGFAIHYIIKRNGIVVANANTSALCSSSAMIGGVFTLPEMRNLGLATSVVYSLCDFLLNKQIIPLLFFENPQAASIYHRIGFIDIDTWYICKKL